LIIEEIFHKFNDPNSFGAGNNVIICKQSQNVPGATQEFFVKGAP
jgi:hypothetical protein